MSKILLVHKNGESLYFEAPHVPKVGEHVGRFQKPFPKVLLIIHFPSEECLEEFQKAAETQTDYHALGVDAIIICE